MNKKEANAILRKKYGASWFDQPGVKDEQRALMRGESVPKNGSSAAESDEAETHGYEVVNEVILGWYDQF